MSDVKELQKEDLEKVSGGVSKEVSDVFEGGLYRSKNGPFYIKVISFGGNDSEKVVYKKGLKQSDGKIHRIDSALYNSDYKTIRDEYNTNNPVDKSLWVE